MKLLAADFPAHLSLTHRSVHRQLTQLPHRSCKKMEIQVSTTPLRKKKNASLTIYPRSQSAEIDSNSKNVTLLKGINNNILNPSHIVTLITVQNIVAPESDHTFDDESRGKKVVTKSVTSNGIGDFLVLIEREK